MTGFDSPVGAKQSLTSLLAKLNTSQPDISALFQQLHNEALRIARAQHRRRGSPDGVAGASDLANSQIASILEKQCADLREIATSDDLRRVLHRMLLDRWIDRRRKAVALKRGGGRVVVASQIAQSGDSDPLDRNGKGFVPPQESEVAADIADVLEVFPDGSTERTIVGLLLAGCTHSEIAAKTGLSPSAVGRRIRNTIAPTLAPILNPPQPEFVARSS